MVEWRKGNKLFTPKSQKPMCVYSCTHMCPCHAYVSVYMSELGCCVCFFWSGQCEGHLLKRYSSPLFSSFPHSLPLIPAAIPKPPLSLFSKPLPMAIQKHPPCQLLSFPALHPWVSAAFLSLVVEKGRMRLFILWVFQVEVCPWALVGKSFHSGSWLDFPWVTENPTSLTTSTINFSQKAPVLTRQVQLRHLILILFLAELILRLAQQKKNLYLYLASVVIYQTPYCY